MTLRHLRIFSAVYEEMSITHAAERLHLSQPGLSQAIHELEDYYHVLLFDRVNRRIRPTEKGIQMYEYAVQITGLFDQMENAIFSPDAPGHLRIGASVTIGSTILPELLQKFQEKFPSCEVNVRIRNSRQIAQAVQQGEMDLGLLEDHAEGEQLEELPFCQDQFCFVCGKNHPLARTSGEKTLFKIEELCAYPFFMRESGSASRDAMDSLVRELHLHYQVTWESISNQAILCALESLDGLSVMTERIVQKEVEAGRLVRLSCCPKGFQRQFSMAYHKKRYRSAALNGMIELLIAYGKESGR